MFVHGFNTSFEEARDRAAQIVADSRFGGVAVLFTWPTKNELFGYVSDKDSATASRDALQGLLQDVSATPGVGKIHVLAHSMGGWLAMEALRQASIAGNRDLAGHLGEVMLASPDIDMDVFAAQMAHIRPAKVTVFATANDRALSLSSAIAAIAPARRRRSIPSKPEDRQALESLGAKVYDLSKLLRRLHRPRRLRGHARRAARDRRADWRRRAREDADKMSIIDASGYADPTAATARPRAALGAAGRPDAAARSDVARDDLARIVRADQGAAMTEQTRSIARHDHGRRRHRRHGIDPRVQADRIRPPIRR